ncbi:tail fiber [Escherichia phage vB_EcoS_ULIM2]|nr:tail fiber [Escherichia phage vB_EcoS_ULIM2]
MALYRRGTASMDADGTVHGTDTKWKDQLALIRVGATIVFLEQPIKLAVISDIVSDTELKAISTDGQTAADGKYVILLNDSLTVNGLAQNVAETLRYYQSKETEIAGAMDIIASLDMDNLNRIVEEIKANKSAAEAAQNQAELARDASAASRDAASQFATSAEQSKNAAKTSETNANSAKTAAETARSQAITAKDQAKGFRDEAEQFANSADASKKVDKVGATINAPTSVADMLKRLRDSVKGGFWRVDDISQFPSGQMTPFKYGPGICGGAGDTFFAFNVDFQTSRVKVFSGNNNAINGSSGNVSAIELAKLGSNGDVAIADGGTGASNDQGARANLQAMHERRATLVSEDLNVLKGDKAGFYFQSMSSNATPERNYPVASAGCLLVQRTGANVVTSCVQTYTTYLDGRRWMRWISNGATGNWSEWYELYNAGSSPTFSGVITGPAVRASVDGKIITIEPGANDVVIHNSASNKFLQLRDNGELAYDNKLIAYNGLAASGTFAMTVPSIKVTTVNGGFRIDGTAATNNQPLHVTGYNSAGKRLWFLGKDTGTSAIFLNDITSSKVELITDGVVLGTKNFAGKAYVQATSLEISRPSGKYFKMLNDGNSSHPATFKLWGNGSDRASVIEFGLEDGPGWLFYAQYNGNGTRQMNVNGTVNCTTVNQSSDRELKDNIKPIENARAGLAKMGGYTYTMKKDGMPYAGVIAQEVMDVVPEAVSTFEDYEHLAGPTQDGEELVGRQRFFQVDYGAIAAYAVQVCKEQEEEIISLRNDVEELKLIVKSLLESK